MALQLHHELTPQTNSLDVSLPSSYGHFIFLHLVLIVRIQ